MAGDSSVSDLERLIAIEDIKVLKAQRDRTVDAQDWDLYETLHAPDHISHNDGHQPWNSAAEMIANLKPFLAGMMTIHHSQTPEITVETPTRASGIWALEDWVFWEGNDEWMQGFGYYYETYEKRDGRWVFTSRRMKRLKRRFSPGGAALLERARAGERERFGLPANAPVLGG